MYIFALAGLFLSISTTVAIDPPIQVQKFEGAKEKGSYIVKLKEGVNKQATLTGLQRQLSVNSTIKYQYEAGGLNGFAGKFSPEALEALLAHKDVESVSEDGIFSISDTQTTAPWGLQRISQPGKLPPMPPINPTRLSYTYTYDPRAGSGVDVYVLDTGIFTEHQSFGGRAIWGYSAVNGTTDGNGHGTHCAGTIGSVGFGVSKKVTLIAVKVLSDAGSGTTSGIVAGIDWVISRVHSTNRPSVISMSLSGGISTALDYGVLAAHYAGIHVVVAAGNANVNAIAASPARVFQILTVGASTFSDNRAPFSNHGPVVDIFAPGEDVISTWIGSPIATNTLSGTSMAVPHVAGTAAYLLSIYGAQSPSALASRIKGLAVSGALGGVPIGTPNLLLQID